MHVQLFCQCCWAAFCFCVYLPLLYCWAERQELIKIPWSRQKTAPPWGYSLVNQMYYEQRAGGETSGLRMPTWPSPGVHLSSCCHFHFTAFPQRSIHTLPRNCWFENAEDKLIVFSVSSFEWKEWDTPELWFQTEIRGADAAVFWSPWIQALCSGPASPLPLFGKY